MIAFRRLGSYDLIVSDLGLGYWALGRLSFCDYGKPAGWSGNSDTACPAGLHKAYEIGVNHGDRSDVYGEGHSE